jgi:hypothetical protein
MNLKVIPLCFSLLVSACAVGPYEERQDPQEPEGPGLFTGAKGEVSLSDYFSEEKKAERARQSYSSRDINVPAIDEDSFEDFENFKTWRRAQEPGSENYQEYQDWRAYQEYRRVKTQKQQAKP